MQIPSALRQASCYGRTVFNQQWKQSHRSQGAWHVEKRKYFATFRGTKPCEGVKFILWEEIRARCGYGPWGHPFEINSLLARYALFWPSPPAYRLDGRVSKRIRSNFRSFKHQYVSILIPPSLGPAFEGCCAVINLIIVVLWKCTLVASRRS